MVQADTSTTPAITAVIKDNALTTVRQTGIFGIAIGPGTAVTVTGNLIINDPRAPSTLAGITASSYSAGSIFGNTVVSLPSLSGLNGPVGIDSYADGISVTSNKVFGGATGISLNTSIAAIKSNTITNSTNGIDFHCSANPNVHSNIIVETVVALDQVPSAINSSNKYFNVGTIRTGGC